MKGCWWLDCSSRVPDLFLHDVLHSAVALSQRWGDPHLVWWHLWVSPAGTISGLPNNHRWAKKSHWKCHISKMYRASREQHTAITTLATGWACVWDLHMPEDDPEVMGKGKAVGDMLIVWVPLPALHPHNQEIQGFLSICWYLALRKLG